MDNKRFQNILEEGEEIKKFGKCFHDGFIARQLLLWVGLSLIAFLPVVIVGLIFNVSDDKAVAGIIMVCSAVAVEVLAVWLVYYISSKRSENFGLCLTNKRLIIRKGFKKTIFKSYQYSEIVDFELTVGHFEKGKDSKRAIPTLTTKKTGEEIEMRTEKLPPIEDAQEFKDELDKEIKK